MEFLLALHGWIRWAVLLVGTLAGFLLLSRRGGRSSSVMAASFVGLLDLQLLLGLFLLALDSEARRTGIPHAAIMVCAVAIAHGMRIRAKKQPGVGPWWPVAAWGVPLALILVGLWILE